MSNLEILRAELDAGHPVTGPYSPDAQIASEQINAINCTELIRITSAELLAWSGQSSAGDRPRLKKIDEGIQSANEQVSAICQVADATINRNGTELDLNRQDRIDMVDALVSASILSLEDRDSLYALATNDISRATQIGLSNVRAGTVEQARALDGVNV